MSEPITIKLTTLLKYAGGTVLLGAVAAGSYFIGTRNSNPQPINQPQQVIQENSNQNNEKQPSKESEENKKLDELIAKAETAIKEEPKKDYSLEMKQVEKPIQEKIDFGYLIKRINSYDKSRLGVKPKHKKEDIQNNLDYLIKEIRGTSSELKVLNIQIKSLETKLQKESSNKTTINNLKKAYDYKKNMLNLIANYSFSIKNHKTFLEKLRIEESKPKLTEEQKKELKIKEIKDTLNKNLSLENKLKNTAHNLKNKFNKTQDFSTMNMLVEAYKKNVNIKKKIHENIKELLALNGGKMTLLPKKENMYYIITQSVGAKKIVFEKKAKYECEATLKVLEDFLIIKGISKIIKTFPKELKNKYSVSRKKDKYSLLYEGHQVTDFNPTYDKSKAKAEVIKRQRVLDKKLLYKKIGGPTPIKTKYVDEDGIPIYMNRGKHSILDLDSKRYRPLRKGETIYETIKSKSGASITITKEMK